MSLHVIFYGVSGFDVWRLCGSLDVVQSELKPIEHKRRRPAQKKPSKRALRQEIVQVS